MKVIIVNEVLPVAMFVSIIPDIPNMKEIMKKFTLGPVFHERNPTLQDVRGLLSARRHWPDHWLAAVRALCLNREY